MGRILAVDDEEFNLRLLDALLTPLGHEVLLAHTGEQCLEVVQAMQPDLILLDVMMPGIDGFEVAQALKRDEATRAIPIVMVTALQEVAYRVRGLEAGAADFLTKPVDKTELKARVESQLKLVYQRRELQQSYDKLRELETLRDNLVHMIVHDMRSPLQSILFSCELLMEEDQLSPSRRGSSTTIMSCTSELINMVNSLLDITRMEAGQMPLDRISCDLRDIAQAVVESAALPAELKKLAVRVDGDSAESVVDHDIIRRVVDNLLGNAIKCSPDGGTIGIHISSTEEATRVTVSNQGQGIPPEYHAKIFEKFGQVELRKQGQRHSSGLGLTFCKLAVETHGGSIGVESEVGKSCTFWFELPRG